MKDDIFLKHDLNLYNFVINLNTALSQAGRKLTQPEQINFSAIDDNDIPFSSFLGVDSTFLTPRQRLKSIRRCFT